jgi:hypothetical protein
LSRAANSKQKTNYTTTNEHNYVILSINKLMKKFRDDDNHIYLFQINLSSIINFEGKECLFAYRRSHYDKKEMHQRPRISYSFQVI